MISYSLSYINGIFTWGLMHLISYLEPLVHLLIRCYSGSIRNSLTIAFSLEKEKKRDFQNLLFKILKQNALRLYSEYWQTQYTC